MNNFTTEILRIARSLIAASTLGDRMSDTEGLVVLPQEPVEPSSLAIASEIIKVAKEVIAIDFPNQKELNKYLHDHPAADRANHRVVKTPEKTKAPEEQKEIPGISYDKSGGRLREHRKSPGSGWASFRDYDVSEKDYRNIEIMHDLPMGKLNQWTEDLQQTFNSKPKSPVKKEMLYAMQVHRSVDAYTGISYRDVNGPLRRGEDVNTLGSETKSMINDLDNFIAYTPKFGKAGEPPLPLYRAIHVAPDVFKNFKVGAVITEPAFLSTSSEYKDAFDFFKSLGNRPNRKRVFIQIEGTRGVSLNDYSQQTGKEHEEHEVLLPRNLKFKITKMYNETIPDESSTTGKIDVIRMNIKPV